MTRATDISEAQPQAQLTQRARQLALLSPQALERAWTQAPAARIDELQGDLRAHFVHLRGEQQLPEATRLALRWLLFSPLFPLRAKRVVISRGVNRLGFGMGQMGFAHFETRYETAWDRDKEVLVLDYAVDENPSWLHPIRDEMCRLEPGLYLGRMGWRTQQKTWFGLYFTLERALV